MSVRPTRLLTQNRELKREGIWNWTLPAWAGRLPDGRTYNTCPQAGVCAKACYALNGTYRFPAVKAAHQRNLLLVLDHLADWEVQMTEELAHKRHAGGWVRIHDAGDFFSDAYLAAWLRIMRARPEVNFYAYTKEVLRFRQMVEPDPPANFRWVYSYGGQQDDLLNPETDRTADVFPDDESMMAAGYVSQDASDLLAVLGPAKVGIPTNNIPAFKKKQGARSFREWQAEARGDREARRQR